MGVYPFDSPWQEFKIVFFKKKRLNSTFQSFWDIDARNLVRSYKFFYFDLIARSQVVRNVKLKVFCLFFHLKVI